MPISLMMPLAAQVGDPLAFYEVAATVIPVLAIALVFEAKQLEPADDEDDSEQPDVGESKLVKSAVQFNRFSEVFAGAVILAIGVTGEVAALRVLDLREPSPDARNYATGSLILLSLGVVGRPLGRALRDFPRPLRFAIYVFVLALLYGAGEIGGSVR